MINILPVYNEKLIQICRATDQDKVCDQRKKTILQGWPPDKANLLAILHPYFYLRDELSTQGRLIFKGNSVLIPFGLRGDIKRAIRSLHLGIYGCLGYTRECIFGQVCHQTCMSTLLCLRLATNS